MIKNVLAAALTLLVADAALAQNSLGRNTAVASNSVQYPQPNGAFALTQSGALTVTTGNSVSCNAGTPTFNHTDNFYYRRFNLDGNFAATGTVTIASVDVGIESAAATGGSQPITVNLYAVPNAAALTVANIGAPIATATVNVANQTGTLLNVPIAAALDGLANDLVIEVFTPETAGNTFFIGSNTTASINPAGAPSFIRAPGKDGCGIDEPTATSGIGFPGMNIVLVANATSLPVSLQKFSVD